MAGPQVSPPVIRVADPATDSAACAQIYAHYVTGTHISFEVIPPDAAEMAARMQSVLTWTPWLVAIDRNGAIEGYAYSSRHRERAGYRWAVDVSVYLCPAVRGRGIGRALYAALFPYLNRQGFHRAYAGITLPNEASVGLHRSFGFVEVGVYRRVGWKDGAWYDVLWMANDVRDDPREPAEPIAFPDLIGDRPFTR